MDMNFIYMNMAANVEKKTLRDGYKSADAGLTPDTQAINKKPGKPLARAARPGNQS